MRTLPTLRQYFLFLSTAALLSACSQGDLMHPGDESPVAAWENSGSGDHPAITPQCSPSTFATLVDELGHTTGGLDGPQPYGLVEVGNSPTHLSVIIWAGYSWQVESACFWAGTAAPQVVNGQVDYNTFGNWWGSTTIQAGAKIDKALTDYSTPIQLVVHARLCQTDFYGEPANFTSVWATGNAVGNAYYFTFNPVPCVPPASPVTLTGGTCQGCNSENSVTFNPATPNCVDVSSCKNLSNVVLQMSDCSHYKYDNLTGRTGSFCSPNGLPIVRVWVKSGCFQSGDGPGYGRKFDNPNATVTCN